MKKYLMMGVAVAAFASCTNHDFDFYDEEAVLEFNKNQIVEKYNQAFIANIGQPAVNQDWGFGTTRALTRAVFSETWNGVHENCKFDESVFDMAVPSGAVDLTKSSFTDAEKKATAFYIPEKFNGELNFNYAFNIPADAKIYNQGTFTAFNSVNMDGKVTFYNIGTMTYAFSNGSRHTVVNSGNLTVTNYANIGDVYNKGALVLIGTESTVYEWNAEKGANDVYTVKKADIPNDMHIYSNGEGTISADCDVDLKAICDIHGTLDVTGNVKIQNSTKKYICGIVATGKVENVDGPLETSYVKADVFSFDGNPIYLLPGGHVDVTTLQVPNSNCHFYGAANSTGFIEAVNYEFGNKNDFTHTFSNNIYFKASGYVKVDNCYAMGQSHNFATVADYLADTTHADEFALAADRINAGNATGTPACGQPWTVGTPTTTPEPETPTDPDPEDDGLTFLCRVFAEDLSASTGSDFDFNDVVFDVYNNVETGKAKIVILAAGGTLPLTVAGKEVHEEFAKVNPDANITTSTMINTWEYGSVNAKVCPEIPLENIKDLADVKDIVLAVEKQVNGINEITNEWIELKAEKGAPAAKFAVTEQVDWCSEREEITVKYPGFEGWVTGGRSTNSRWWAE